MTDTTRRSITAASVGLVAASTALQVASLAALGTGLGRLDAGTVGRHLFSTVEMALVAALVWQGVRIVAWARESGAPPLVARAARLCLGSLVLCALGDLVNRNYLGEAFRWDDVIRHSYLVTSIVWFLPGYAVVVAANRIVTRGAVPARAAAATGVVAGLVGVVVFASGFDAEVATGASALILAYSVTLAVLAGSVLWLGRAFGWRASAVVVVGCLLAPVADALIANLWLYRDHFPAIEHVNWIVYFASLAMIQRLPFLVADAGGDAR